MTMDPSRVTYWGNPTVVGFAERRRHAALIVRKRPPSANSETTDGSGTEGNCTTSTSSRLRKEGSSRNLNVNDVKLLAAVKSNEYLT